MSAPPRRSALLTRRALGLGVLALGLIAAMVGLGLWQLGVYDDHQRDDAHAKLARAPVPIDQVLGPDDAFPSSAVSRPVLLTGQYLPAETFEVRGSPRLDAPAVVVTPLQVRGGSVVLVVRGRGGVDASAPPTGTVDVTGVLQPSDATGAALGSSRVTSGIRTAALVQDVREDLYAGYVVLTSSSPRDPLAVVLPPTPEPSRWAGIRNFVYAVQWWVFAGFVAFMWWRVVTDDAAASPPRSVG